MVKMRMEAEAVSHSRTDVSVRGLTSVIDEPVERGGTNLGFSPTETLIASLLGCTNVISHKVAHRMGVEIARHEDPRRSRLRPPRRHAGRRRRRAVSGAHHDHRGRTTSADAAQMDQLRRELAMYCPISKVIRAAGTNLDRSLERDADRGVRRITRRNESPTSAPSSP